MTAQTVGTACMAVRVGGKHLVALTQPDAEATTHAVAGPRSAQKVIRELIVANRVRRLAVIGDRSNFDAGAATRQTRCEIHFIRPAEAIARGILLRPIVESVPIVGEINPAQMYLLMTWPAGLQLHSVKQALKGTPRLTTWLSPHVAREQSVALSFGGGNARAVQAFAQLIGAAARAYSKFPGIMVVTSNEAELAQLTLPGGVFSEQLQQALPAGRWVGVCGEPAVDLLGALHVAQQEAAA